MGKVPQYDGFAREFQEAASTSLDPNRAIMYGLIGDSELEGFRLLDLGCGPGEDLGYFSEQGAEVYGVDVSSKMIELAGKRVPSANLSKCSFDSLPHEDNFFDFVFSRYAIQHVEDVGEVFREAHRVLKPDGGLVFLVTHPIRQFIEKTNKDYWGQEVIRSNILGGRVTVEEPSHTFEEYFSPFLLSSFRLKTFIEREDPEAETLEDSTYPGALIMKYVKK